MNYTVMKDKELLSCILDNPTADLMLNEFPDIAYAIVNSSEKELMKIKGIGEKKAVQIKAIGEIAKRLYKTNYEKCEYRISSPKDAADLFMADLRYQKQEYLNVALLDTRNVVIEVVNVSKGSLNSSIVHPREVFVPAVKLAAASIIIAHCHPSGDPKPSSEDLQITKRLKECGTLMGIDLLDHIIIGNGTYVSLKEKGDI